MIIIYSIFHCKHRWESFFSLLVDSFFLSESIHLLCRLLTDRYLVIDDCRHTCWNDIPLRILPDLDMILKARRHQETRSVICLADLLPRQVHAHFLRPKFKKKTWPEQRFYPPLSLSLSDSLLQARVNGLFSNSMFLFWSTPM